jgi:hypothetical protein
MTALPQDVASDLERENARLQAELRSAREHQAASAEILRTIASAPGDAERSLQQIAETSARLFGAASVQIQLAKDGEWGKGFRFGASAQQVRLAVPLEKIRIGGRNLPGAVIGENRQIHIPTSTILVPMWPTLSEFRTPAQPARARSAAHRCGARTKRSACW